MLKLLEVITANIEKYMLQGHHKDKGINWKVSYRYQSYLRQQLVIGRWTATRSHKNKTQTPHTCWGLTVGAAQTPIRHKNYFRVTTKTFQVSHRFLSIRFDGANLEWKKQYYSNPIIIILNLLLLFLIPYSLLHVAATSPPLHSYILATLSWNHYPRHCLWCY